MTGKGPTIYVGGDTVHRCCYTIIFQGYSQWLRGIPSSLALGTVPDSVTHSRLHIEPVVPLLNLAVGFLEAQVPGHDWIMHVFQDITLNNLRNHQLNTAGTFLSGFPGLLQGSTNQLQLFSLHPKMSYSWAFCSYLIPTWSLLRFL